MKYEKYNKGKNDLFSGIVLGGFAIAYLIGATMIKIPKMLSASLLNASSVPKLWGVLLLILGIVPVGFLISTFLFLFAEFNILTYKEDRKLGFSVVFALVCAVGIYAMFKYGFKMPLPQGILKGIF